ncbi:MAG: hypothetical protein L0Y56_10790 [Nitrospira sp.]|nr:hypothetical protein [Nitrospira sp.]
MRQGRPLVGMAGQTWNGLMHHAGLIRRQVYILNLFPFMVEKSGDKKNIYMRGRPDQVLWTLKYGFTDLATPHLRSAFQKIRASGVNVIISLGGTATAALCPWIKSIQKWRGSPCMTDVESTGLRRKVIPTYHPAALSWGAPYIWRYDIIADLRKAKRESISRKYQLPPCDIIIRPRLPQFMDFIKGCRSRRLVNTDIECYGRTVTCFSLAHSIDSAICIPLMDENGHPYWSENEEATVWWEYAKLMGDPTITKINQNIIFDMWVLFMANNIITRGPVEDPMIMQGILYPDFPKKLEYITSIHADMPYYKDDKKLWKNFWKDITGFWNYNGKDSIASLRCKLSLEEEVKEKGYEQQYRDYLDDVPSLLYMMCRGVPVDGIALEKVRKHVEGLLTIKEKELSIIAGYELNAMSSKQMIQYFYIEKGYKPYYDIKTKRPTVNDVAHTRIAHKHKDKAAKCIQEVRRLNKLKGTYYDVQVDDDWRLRTSYLPAGSGHGRLSSKKNVFDEGLDMQNLDPEFKAFIIPGKD